MSDVSPLPLVSAQAYHHQPVLMEQVLSLLPLEAKLVVDATLGSGGHAAAILKRLPQAELFGADRDPHAIQAAKATLAPFAHRVLLKNIPFSQLPHHVLLGSVDFLLADLGVSSPQLDQGPRGFSFMREGPLDMRMDPGHSGPTAADIVNRAREAELLDILYKLGEERFAPRIVRAILAQRAQGPLTTTTQLADLVTRAVPAKFHRHGHHPATRTFQALRMKVNDELGELDQLLNSALDLLAPGGRVAIIAFHSLEDRMVKERMRLWEQPCTCPPRLPMCVCGKKPLGHRLTKKPLEATPEEADANPRSRSAKLRGFEKGGDGL